MSKASKKSAPQQNKQSLKKNEKSHGALLIFVNPHSGQGKSLDTFNNKVAPKLDQNNIRYELIITDGPNHARTVLMEKGDLGTFNGLLILSGDGLVFEAVNGILGRDDAMQILKSLPIAIVPSGSGNGLLCSVLSKYGTEMNPKAVMERALEIATSSSAKAESVALYSVKTEKENYGSFLSIGWGLMADIDIESEKWRKSLGSFRFTAMGVVRSIVLRSYKGRLTYRLYEPNDYQPKSNKFDVYENSTQERIEKGNNLKTWELHENSAGEEIVVEDVFLNVYAVTLSHIAADGPYAPSAQLEDNRIHLSYVLLKDIGTRIDVARYLLAIEHQKHLNMAFLKTVEVSSFKLEVLDNSSYIVLDGEKVDTKTIEVQSTRNTISVFSSTD
uniref:DAGKc domain-containing protein n=1 Tax=Caenorhabditis tropicalis TaxID=1561998 RepID=A0A1I7TLM3_9PELO